MDNIYKFFKTFSSRFRAKRQENTKAEVFGIHCNDAISDESLQVKETDDKNIVKSRKESKTKKLSKKGDSCSTEVLKKYRKNRQNIPQDKLPRSQNNFHIELFSRESFKFRSGRIINDKSKEQSEGLSKTAHTKVPKSSRKRHAGANDAIQPNKIMKTETSSSNGISIPEISDVRETSNTFEVTRHQEKKNCPSQFCEVIGVKETGNLRKYVLDSDANNLRNNNYTNIKTSKMLSNKYVSKISNNSKPMYFRNIFERSIQISPSGNVKIDKSPTKEDSCNIICMSSDKKNSQATNDISEVISPFQYSVETPKRESIVEEKDVPVVVQKSQNVNCKTIQSCLTFDDISACESSVESSADNRLMHLTNLSTGDIKIILDTLQNSKTSGKEKSFDAIPMSEESAIPGENKNSWLINRHNQTNYCSSQNFTLAGEKRTKKQRSYYLDYDTVNQKNVNSEVNSIMNGNKPISKYTMESSTSSKPRTSTLLCTESNKIISENNIQNEDSALKGESFNVASLSEASIINGRNYCSFPSSIVDLKMENAMEGQNVPSVIQNTENTSDKSTDCSITSDNKSEFEAPLNFANVSRAGSLNWSSDYLQDFSSTSNDKSEMSWSTNFSDERPCLSSTSGESDIEHEVTVEHPHNIQLLKYISLNTSMDDIEELYHKMCKDTRNGKLYYFHRKNMDKSNRMDNSSLSDLQSSYSDSYTIVSPNKPFNL